MARKLKSDRVLFTATFLLVCASVVMVYSASAVMALDRPHGLSSWFLAKQLLWAALGLGVLAFVMRVDYRTYRTDAFVWGLLALVGVMLVAVMFSRPINGSRRWFGVGSLGIQPSELAKLACIFFTALVLERRMHRIDEIKYSLAPIGIIVGLMFGLIMLQPDFGTASTLVLIAGIMIFAAGLNYRYLTGLFLVAAPTLSLILWAAPYRRKRVLVILDPWADRFGDGYHIVQSMIALGTGGVFGRGLMAGVQKLFYLPEPHTDFIYAVIGEEMGLIGTAAILGCFCVIAWRGVRIATRAEDGFGAFLAIGLTTMIAVQALVNISVVLGLLPTKGIALPLISAGGSSLLVNLLGMGVLLNISQHESADADA